MKTLTQLIDELRRGNGHAAGPAVPAELLRVPASQLRKLSDAERWLWRGLIPSEMATIFSALPKAGKTTLLAHLLRAMEAGGDFCGQEVRPGRVVYVTEESETLWANRRDQLGLKDHCEFVLRPFRAKPTRAEWQDFLKRLEGSLTARPVELVVIDTLAKLWPVQQENDASEVTAALMPLLELAYGLKVALLLVHHLRKSDGQESTATRGSGGITASVDSILELRRYRPGDRKDRRRVICCDSRFEDRLDEAVLQLADDGLSYLVHGDRHDTARGELEADIPWALPGEPPGWTAEEIRQAWPSDQGAAQGLPGPPGCHQKETGAPSVRTLRNALQHGADTGLWGRTGTGTRGDPYRYFQAQ
jgi:hypothetical protein